MGFYFFPDNPKLTTDMTQKHTNESAAFSLQAKQANANGEHYTPLGVLSKLAQLGEPLHGGLCDPCCGTGWNVSAEMLNRAHLAAS
jgi:type I restriction-modification system DNA methylase subunit